MNITEIKKLNLTELNAYIDKQSKARRRLQAWVNFQHLYEEEVEQLELHLAYLYREMLLLVKIKNRLLKLI